MKITFLGATRQVTGSNYLVEAAGKRFLVDCGLHQGSMEEELLNERPFDFNPEEIDFMLLTHAHIDHSGRIPKLYKDGFKGPLYATEATCELCSIMLPDSGHIQETENEIRNKKRKRAGKKEMLDPLYTAQDAVDSMEIFKPIKYDKIYKVAPGIEVRFVDAGHMLGSSMIEVWIKEEKKEKQKIVFTGDIGNSDIPLLNSPTVISSADYLIMESTYGNRIHMKNDQKAELFLKIVSETIDNGGTVVIPSFAVGRTQEILYEINKLKERHLDDAEFQKEYETLMKAPVYVDSPLAVSATEIFMNNMDLFSPEIQKFIKKGDNPLEFPGLKFTRTVDESKALNESDEPCIIISASGMCDVGRIKHHLKHNIWNSKSTILFVGYQAPGTLGNRIVNGAKEVKILGEEFAVKARVEYIEGFSGHADQEGLLNYVLNFEKGPQHIFLVHGEPESQDTLKAKLQETTPYDIITPHYGEEFELNKEIVVNQRFKDPAQAHLNRFDLIEKMETLQQELEDITHALKEDIRLQTGSDEQMTKLNNKVNDLRKQIVDIMNKGDLKE